MKKREAPGTYVKRIKQNHKYYVIGVWNGRTVEKKRWSFNSVYKDNRTVAINKKDAVEIFKQNRSFDSSVKRSMLANMYETTDFSVNVKRGKERGEWRGPKKVTDANIPRNVMKYQWICKGYVNVHGKLQEVSARSEQHERSYPLEKARDEAFERFLMRLNGALRFGHGTGDADKGFNDFDRVTNFYEGPVYYQAI
jgi:hypothetical protein